MTGDAGEIVDLAALARGRDIDVPAVGSSMVPWVRHGDVVRVTSASRCLPRRGDIVLVALETRWVLHRLVSIEGDRIVTRGDNVGAADPPTGRVRLLGVARWTRRRGRGPRIPLRWPAALRDGWVAIAPVVRRGLAAAWRLRRRGIRRG